MEGPGGFCGSPKFYPEKTRFWVPSLKDGIAELGQIKKQSNFVVIVLAPSIQPIYHKTSNFGNLSS